MAWACPIARLSSTITARLAWSILKRAKFTSPAFRQTSDQEKLANIGVNILNYEIFKSMLMVEPRIEPLTLHAIVALSQLSYGPP